MDTTDSVFAGFNDGVLARWGLKPAAKDILSRAQATGAITPHEITQMVSAELAKDRKKMAGVLAELKKALGDLKISVTFHVVQHIRVEQSADATARVPDKPEPQGTGAAGASPITRAESVATLQPPQEERESPFLNTKILQENGLKPEALGILFAAQARGSITSQEVGVLIPAETSRDTGKLRSTMQWITRLLAGLNIRIVIGEIHYKNPQSKSPETSYSRRPKQPSVNRNEQRALPEHEKLGEEPSEAELTALEREDGEGLPEDAENEGGEFADPNEEFVPKFIFDKAAGVANPYYRAVKDHTFLRHRDILELSRRWRLDGDVGAFQKIVQHHLRYSMKIAAHYMGRGLDYDDLVQEGNIGLMVAAERFDPERGFHFSTYATWWVKQKIRMALRNQKDTIRTPSYIHDTANHILKITCDLGAEFGREPTLEEVAAKAGMEADKVRRVLNQLKIPVVSMEELAHSHSSGDSNTQTVGETLQDNYFPSALTALEAKEDLEAASRVVRTLLAAVKALPMKERLKTAFKMYYGLDGHEEDHTLESIAASPGFGVTRERIRQMINLVWQRLGRHGIVMNDEGLMAALNRVRDLEDIACTKADLSTPAEELVLDDVLVVFQDQLEANEDGMVPGVTITQKRPTVDPTGVQLNTPTTTTPEDIIRVVGGVCKESREAILGESRKKDTAWARKVCIYIMREALKLSFPAIGQALGYTCHTSVIHGHQSVKKAIVEKPGTEDEIKKIFTLCGFRSSQSPGSEQADLATEPVVRTVSPIVDQMLTLTSQVFNVEKASLLTHSRTGPGVPETRTLARGVAIYLLRTDFNLQRQDITPTFGFADDGRVSVICAEMEEQTKTDTGLQVKLALIRSQYSLDVYGGDLAQVRRQQNILFPKQVEELGVVAEKVVRSFQESVQRLHAKLEVIDVPDRHKEIFRLRFGGDPAKEIPAYEAIGQTYDVTRARIQQILVATMAKLTPTLDQTDVDLVVNYTQEYEKARLVVELQNL